jgi:hypothetical protein
MKPTQLFLFSLCAIILTSCASGYQTINPKRINYASRNTINDVSLEYKYDLLSRKYEKKEVKKGVKLVALKITNNSDKDLTFGNDVKLTFQNGNEVFVMEHNQTFLMLKQSPATYLLYLLLTPINLYTTETNSYGMQEETSSTPVGLIVGPGLAGGNIIAASSANKKFKTDLLEYNLNGTRIKKGQTVYGLVGIKTNSYETLTLRVD